MTNGEKYKTAKERESAFADYCDSHEVCFECPLHDRVEPPFKCKAAWLKMVAPESEVLK